MSAKALAAADAQLRAAWLHGPASDGDLDRLAAVLHEHPAAAQQLQGEQRLHHSLCALLTPGNAGSVAQRLRSSVMNELRTPTSAVRIRYPWWAAAAAVAALLVGAVWWWTVPAATDAPLGTSPALASGLIDDARDHLAAGAALPEGRDLRVEQAARVTWGSGNAAELPAGARFRWQGHDDPQLLLHYGSAQVHIAQGPFALQLPDMQAQVLGTAFSAHHGWWGSSIRVDRGQVAVTAADRSATLEAGQARWLFQPEAREMQEHSLQEVDSTWRPAAMQLVLDQSALGHPHAWQGAVTASTTGQHLQGNGRFLPAIPGDPSFVRLRLQLDRLDGRAGLAISGDSQRLAGASLHQDVVGVAWEMELRAWKVLAWPGEVATWLVEGHVNQQPLRFQVDSDAFSAGFVLDGDALVESFSVESSDAWPVQHIPHPDR